MIEEKDLHKKSLSTVEERKEAAGQIGHFFEFPNDKEQAWRDLHRLARDEDRDVRFTASMMLGLKYPYLPNKEQAWDLIHYLIIEREVPAIMGAIWALKSYRYIAEKDQAWEDLHLLTLDQNSLIRRTAADALGDAFKDLPDKFKNQAWNDLRRLIRDNDACVRSTTVSGLRWNFAKLPDNRKDQACADIHQSSLDKDEKVRWWTASILGSAFSCIPEKNKEQAWGDLYQLANDENKEVREATAEGLGLAIPYIPDKYKRQAWKEMHLLIKSDDAEIRRRAIRYLGSAFSHISDKHQALEDLHNSINDEDEWVRGWTAKGLSLVFPHVTANIKERVWNDLHQLTKDKKVHVRSEATIALGWLFPCLDDKFMGKAWQDLHNLVEDESEEVRGRATWTLCQAMYYIPLKDQGWNDLLELIKDQNQDVRRESARTLGFVYRYINDKERAWNDICKLISYEDPMLLSGEAEALGIAYPYIPDNAKDQAWAILHQINEFEDALVHWNSVKSIGLVFPFLSPKNKDEAWLDLYRFTKDENEGVRREAAEALGIVLSYLPDKFKEQAERCLFELSLDSFSGVRVCSNHSLGKLSILKATESNSESHFRKELEKSLEFFERSEKEAIGFYPSRFCLPFYRSFYSIIFLDAGIESESEKYLNDAREVIAGSRNRTVLLEAMENLAFALKEMRGARRVPLDNHQSDLKAFSHYCDKVEDLLTETETSAPIATKLLRRSLPIISRRIRKELLEIEQESTRFCENTRGTLFESSAKNIHEITKGLSLVEIHGDAEEILDELIPEMKVMCAFLPHRSQESTCVLSNWDNLDFKRKVTLFKRTISYCSVHMENLSQQIESLKSEGDEKDRWIEYFKEQVIIRLDNINFNVFKLKIHSADAVRSLTALKKELEKVNRLKSDLDRLGQNLEDLDIYQRNSLFEFKSEIPRIVEQLEHLARIKQSTETQKILEDLQSLKRTPSEKFIETAGLLVSIIDILLTIYKL